MPLLKYLFGLSFRRCRIWLLWLHKREGFKVKKFILFLLLVSCAFGTSRTASSVSAADINSKTALSSDGDTVFVPAGSATYTGTEYVDFGTKAIKLIGAGVNQTIIRDNTTTDNYNYGAVTLSTNANKAFRITGITFRQIKASASGGMIHVEGAVRAFRIDHCNFDSMSAAGSSRAIMFSGTDGYGLIDHDTIRVLSGAVQGITMLMNDSLAFTRPLSLGTDSAVFVEDCYFSYATDVGDNCFDGRSGLRYVFRHNTVVGSFVGHHGARDGSRGTLSFEIYNNKYSSGDHNCYTCYRLNGGTGVIFNDTFTVTGSGAWGDKSAIMGYYRVRPAGQGGTLYDCDGTHAWDSGGTGSGIWGYPCLDNPGWTTNGHDTLPLLGPHHQILSPMYAWNNTVKDGASYTTINWKLDDNPAEGQHPLSGYVHENKEYYNTSTTYTPYTYPHPLQGSAAPAASKKCTITINR